MQKLCFYVLLLLLLSCFNHVRLCATLWTAAHQAPLFMGLSRQEYWTVLPFPPPGDLPDPDIELQLLNLLNCMQILCP